MAKKATTVDETCEAAIAASAVEAREWSEANRDDGFAQTYREDYADRFYGAGRPAAGSTSSRVPVSRCSRR